MILVERLLLIPVMHIAARLGCPNGAMRRDRLAKRGYRIDPAPGEYPRINPHLELLRDLGTSARHVVRNEASHLYPDAIPTKCRSTKVVKLGSRTPDLTATWRTSSSALRIATMETRLTPRAQPRRRTWLVWVPTQRRCRRWPC